MKSISKSLGKAIRTITLREGAVDYGRIYEQKTAALFAIRCALNPMVKDFWIASNIGGFGAFDHPNYVILLTESDSGTKTVYCIQLKHIENKPLKANQLVANSGNFRIEKYSESYKSIEKNIKSIDELKGITMDQMYFILYTNAELTEKEKAPSIVLENCGSFDFLCTRPTTENIFKVSNAANSVKPFDENFLKRFLIYTDQAAATSLDKLIKNEFDIYFDDISNRVIVTITDYFAKWTLGKKSKFKPISKKDLHTKLVEYLLQPYIVEPKHDVSRQESILKMLNDTLTSFNITPVLDTRSLQNVFASVDYVINETCDIKHNFKTSWHTNLTEKQHDILKRNDKESKQLINGVFKERHQYVAQTTIRDLYISAWQCNMVPLIVNCDLSYSTIKKILFKFEQVTKELSFVLLNPSDVDDFKNNLKVFRNFNDITDPNLLDRNLDNTYVSLQGREKLSVKEFKDNIEVLNEITPDLYLTLLDGVLQIGEKYDVEDYYIKRSLLRPVLSLEVLEESNVKRERDKESNGDIFLIVEFTDEQYFPYEYKPHMVDMVAYVQSVVSGKINEEKYILTTKLPSTHNSVKVIVETLHAEIKKSIHVLKVQNNYLEWLYTMGTIDIIRDYVEEMPLIENSECIHEDAMLEHFQSRVNIISNNAGMGKTFLLKSLANKFDPDKWVCFVGLSEHIPKIFQRNAKDAKDFILYINEWQVNINNSKVRRFCKQLLRDRWNTSNTIWLLDGYDEVSSEDVLSFLKGVRELSNVKMWVTTRPTYNKELENIMGALSLQVTHFRDQDHVDFLWKYFETFYHIYGYTEEQIKYIIDTINKCSLTLDKTFIAIPLQTRMFAEIFGDDINQISEMEQLTIVDLYNKFVDIKLKEYKSYEATSLKKTLSKLALKLFYTDDQLEDLLDFEELREEALTFQDSYKKDSIVIGLDENGDAVFGHRTFAEFMAAHWLSKQIVTRKGKCNEDWRPLVEKLFYMDMFPVRVFFDKIVCQDLPLHQAVLSTDVENVKKLLEEDALASDVDKLGRSALHLAVSYGQYHDMYLSHNIKGIKAIGMHTRIEDKSPKDCRIEIPKITLQLEVPTELIEELLDHGLANDVDLLFQYDVFDYAMKSCSLDAVNCLFKRMEKEALLIEPEVDFRTFLYNVIFHNLYHILSKRKIFDFDVTSPAHHELRQMFSGYNSRLLDVKFNEYYLTEIAAHNGGKETVFELLLTGKLTVEDGIPVHRACFGGHSEVVDLLFKMGADIKKLDKDGWSPLYQAGRQGRSDITYQFLKSTSRKTNMSKTLTNMTPMHYACQGGHLDCAKKLMELGASCLDKDAFANTPLYYASLYGHMSIVGYLLDTFSEDQRKEREVKDIFNVIASKGYCTEILIEKGLDVNNLDKNGDTPLILASKNGFPKVIEELVRSKKVNLNLMKSNESLDSIMKYCQLHNHDFLVKLFPLALGRNSKQHGGLSALHFAILEDQIDCVKSLLQFGADKTIEDTIGLDYSPMIWAAIWGRGKIIEVLLKTDSSPDVKQRDLEDAEIALIWASILGHLECVETLLDFIRNSDNLHCSRNEERLERILKCEYGTDYPKFVRPFEEVENVALVGAAINNRFKAIIMQHVWQYKISQRDLNIALMYACKKGHLETILTVLNFGADEHAKNEKNLKILPIVWASMNGHAHVIEFLLKNKPQEYSKNEDVAIALNFAAINNHLECVKLLLDFGFDVNHVYKDLNGGTPLLNACQYSRNDDVINELLSRDCDVRARDNEGKTALEKLAKMKKFDVVKRILGMGAAEDVVDEDSDFYRDLQEVMDWAVANEESDVVHKLVEMGVKEKEKLKEVK